MILELFLSICYFFDQSFKHLGLKQSNRLITVDSNCFYDQTYNIRQTSNTNLCLYRCNFQSIQTTSLGGAIYIYISSISTPKNYFEDCVFNNCEGSTGGACYISAPQLSNTEINNCTFVKNFASEQGGSLYILRSHFTITKSYFDHNLVNRSNSCVYGGSVSISNAEGNIKECEFTHNFATFVTKLSNYYKSYGGGIYLYQSSSTFRDCYFYNNTISSSRTGGKTEVAVPEQYGGAIMMTTSICQFTNCTFYNNTGNGDASFIAAPSEGAAIYTNISSLIDVYHCNFTNNLLYEAGPNLGFIQTLYGSAVMLRTSNGTFYECDFYNNTSYANATKSINALIAGPAVFLYESRGSFEKCNFFNNSALIFSVRGSFPICRSGAIGSWDYEFNCTNCTFVNNKSFYNGPSDEIFGGALFSLGGNLTNCCFQDNTALHGGHIYYSQTGTSYKNYKPFLFINNCNFSTTHDENGYMKSLFYFSCSGNTTLVNQFNNCQISFSNINSSSYLFEGYVKKNRDEHHKEHPSFFKFYFVDNCISSLDIIYKTNSLYFTDELGENNLTFESSFQSICDHQVYCVPVQFDNIPTYEFTSSRAFTNSNALSASSFFTKSLAFSNSLFFTVSNTFTSSQFFTESLFFTESNPFTKSRFFTESNAFKSSQFFTESSPFTKSRFFSNSNIFSQSNAFSKTSIFIETSAFTESLLFSESQCFSDEFHDFDQSISIDSGSIFDSSESVSYSDDPISSSLSLDSNEILPDLNTDSSDSISTSETELSESGYSSTNEMTSILDSESDISDSASNLESSLIESSLISESNLIESSLISESSLIESSLISESNLIESSLISESNLTESASIVLKKGGISKAAIIGIIIGVVAAILIIAAVIIVLAIKKRKKKEDNSINEGQSRQASFVETKQSKSQTDNSLNVDDDDDDLDFWL